MRLSDYKTGMGFGLHGQRESCRTRRQLDRTERQKDLEGCEPVYNPFFVCYLAGELDFWITSLLRAAHKLRKKRGVGERASLQMITLLHRGGPANVEMVAMNQKSGEEGRVRN